MLCTLLTLLPQPLGVKFIISYYPIIISIEQIGLNFFYGQKIKKMKVLKFGGTSVGSSENIKKIVEIISKNDSDATQFIVVSAFATVTNLLLDAAQLASIKNSSYTTVLQKIKDIH